MGGLWQAAVMGFGGVRRHDETLVIDPHLPEEWTSLDFSVRFRGSRFHVAARRGEIDLTVGDAPATVMVGRRKRKLTVGVHHFRKGARSTWEEET
jgi:trehalose/maltose hydrolase-like predicted phosphorylase